MFQNSVCVCVLGVCDRRFFPLLSHHTNRNPQGFCFCRSGRRLLPNISDQQPVSYDIARNTNVSSIIPEPWLFTRLESSLGRVQSHVRYREAKCWLRERCRFHCMRADAPECGEGRILEGGSFLPGGSARVQTCPCLHRFRT